MILLMSVENTQLEGSEGVTFHLKDIEETLEDGSKVVKELQKKIHVTLGKS